MVSLNWRREPKPAAKATSTSGIELCVIRARAVWTRRLRARWSGEAPIAAEKRRSSVRELTPSRWATPSIPPPSARPAAMSRSARPTSAPSGSSSRSGRQRLQARTPAASAAAGEGRKRTWSRRGVRDGHPMRQYTPVVVTATRNLPSKRRSRLATARYRLSKSSTAPWCGEGHGGRPRVPDRAVGGAGRQAEGSRRAGRGRPEPPRARGPDAGGDVLVERSPQLGHQRGERLVLLLEVRLDLHRLVEYGLRIGVGVLGPLVAGSRLDVGPDDDDGEEDELEEGLGDPGHRPLAALGERRREAEQREDAEDPRAGHAAHAHGDLHRQPAVDPGVAVAVRQLVMGLGWVHAMFEDGERAGMGLVLELHGVVTRGGRCWVRRHPPLGAKAYGFPAPSGPPPVTPGGEPGALGAAGPDVGVGGGGPSRAPATPSPLVRGTSG